MTTFQISNRHNSQPWIKGSKYHGRFELDREWNLIFQKMTSGPWSLHSISSNSMTFLGEDGETSFSFMFTEIEEEKPKPDNSGMFVSVGKFPV